MWPCLWICMSCAFISVSLSRANLAELTAISNFRYGSTSMHEFMHAWSMRISFHWDGSFALFSGCYSSSTCNIQTIDQTCKNLVDNVAAITKLAWMARSRGCLFSFPCWELRLPAASALPFSFKLKFCIESMPGPLICAPDILSARINGGTRAETCGAWKYIGRTQFNSTLLNPTQTQTGKFSSQCSCISQYQDVIDDKQMLLQEVSSAAA